MKSYEEMAEDIFRRRDEYLEKKRKTRKIIFSGLSPAVCGCLVIAMTMGFFVKADNNTEPQNTEGITTQTQITEKDDKLSILENEDIIWADFKMMGKHLRMSYSKDGVSLYGELYDIFDDLDDDQLIAVTVSSTESIVIKNEKYRGVVEGVYYREGAGGFIKFDDKQHYYMGTTLNEMRDKGLSWTEIIESEIDYFMELCNDEYGRINARRLEAQAIEKYYLDVRTEFESLGLNVIYDGTDIEWGTYFQFRGGGVCVVLTTPRQIKELGKTEQSRNLHFGLAPKDPAVATKHIYFTTIYRNIPTDGYFIPLYPGQEVFDSSTPKVYLDGYNGNVDEYYEYILKKREAKGE